MPIIKNKNIKWWLGLISCITLFIFIGIFAYMKMDFLFRGVQINSLVIHKSNPSSLVTVSGKATHATYISLNDREIFIGPDGTFTEELALLPGLSILTLKAEDKFGHTSDKKLEVVYQESTGVVAVSNPIINTN